MDFCNIPISYFIGIFICYCIFDYLVFVIIYLLLGICYHIVYLIIWSLYFLFI